jgi:hypothetical protein
MSTKRSRECVKVGCCGTSISSERYNRQKVAVRKEEGKEKRVVTTWYSPVLPGCEFELVWRWKFGKKNACDDIYDKMIDDWRKTAVEMMFIRKDDWVDAIDRFVKRPELFVSSNRDTELMMVLTKSNELLIVKEDWVERKGSVDSELAALSRLGLWDNIAMFLWQPVLPQRELSVYLLSFYDGHSRATFTSDQTTSYLETGLIPNDLWIERDVDTHNFLTHYGALAGRAILVGCLVGVRTNKKASSMAIYRILSTTVPFHMVYENYAEGTLVAQMSLYPPRAITKSDMVALASVNRETAFITRSSIKCQQRIRLFERGVVSQSLHASVSPTHSLEKSCGILKRISKLSMRCNFDDVHNLQETYHFTPKHISIISSMLCPNEPACASGGVDGVYYAGCGLGREVLAMSMSNPRTRFFANDIGGGGSEAVDTASALRASGVAFGMIVAGQIDVSAASMCSAYSASRQTTANGVLYSTVTSLDILRGTLRRAIFGGVQTVCILSNLAKPPAHIAGSTFDAAVASAALFALGPGGYKSIQKKMKTNIPGGSVVVYDFSAVPPPQRRLIMSGILAECW